MVAAGGRQLRRVDGVRERGQPAPLTRRDAPARTAVRAALGATRGQLVRLPMMEGLVLAAVGGALGALASVWILDGILAMLPPYTLASTADPRLNLPVLLFAMGATMFAGALCGSAQA